VESGSRPALKPLAQLLEDGGDFGDVRQFWQAVQENIRERLGYRRYSLWFQQAELMSFQDRELVVGVPNIIIQQYLGQRYRNAVADAATELLGEPVSVKFDIAPRLFRKMSARREAERLESNAEPVGAVDFARPTLEAPVPPQWGFENLFCTRSNQLPFAAARELAGQENPRFRFLYVCGDYGLGKTALLRAIYALAHGRQSGLDTVLVSAEDWCNEYYHAIQHKTTRQFRKRYRSRRMLLLDDVQFVQGKSAGQQELLHTIKHVLANGGRVALAAKPHREELRDLEPAFQALLQRALPVLLMPPEDDERLPVVKDLAGKCGLVATEEVYRYVAGRRGTSFGVAESAVCCLAMYASVHGCGQLGLTAAMEAFATIAPARLRRVGLDQIREAVLEVFDVPPERLTGKCRSRTVLLARQVAMYLARRLTGASLTEIGRFFGRSSHSTVKHAVDKVEGVCREDTQLAGLVRRIESRLRAA